MGSSPILPHFEHFLTSWIGADGGLIQRATWLRSDDDRYTSDSDPDDTSSLSDRREARRNESIEPEPVVAEAAETVETPDFLTFNQAPPIDATHFEFSPSRIRKSKKF